MDIFDDLREIENERKIEKVALDISLVAYFIELLESTPSPYPTQVITWINEISNAHTAVINPKVKKYLSDAIKMALAEHPDQRTIIESYSVNPSSLDLEKLKMDSFDKYFLNFRNYWESAIQDLRRPSAKLNRRKYLVEKIKEWKLFLANQGISKYDAVLDEYLSFNVAELSMMS